MTYRVSIALLLFLLLVKPLAAQLLSQEPDEGDLLTENMTSRTRKLSSFSVVEHLGVKAEKPKAIIRSEKALMHTFSIFSVADGAWNSAATWNTGMVPSAGDDVQILHTVNLPSSTITVNHFEIGETGRLQTVNSDEFIITGDLTINGVLDSRESNTPEPNIRLTGTNTTIDGTGLIEFTADLNNNDNRIFFFEGNTTIAATANLTFDHQDTDNPDFIQINDGVTVTNNGTVTINRSVFGEGATATWTNGIGGSLTIGGDLLTTGVLIASATDNTIEYNGSASQTIKDPQGSEYFNLTTGGTNTKSLTTATSILGSLTNSSIFNPANNNITIGGNWSNSGTYQEGAETVTFSATSSQSVSGIATEVFNNLTISISGNTWSSAIDIQVTGTLDITDALINMGENRITLGSGTGSTGTFNTTGTVVISGEFERWVNAANQTGLIFPVGAGSQANQIELDINTLDVEGSLVASFTADTPTGINNPPLSDDGVQINNVYTEGFWTLSAENSLSASDYDLSLTGSGFDSFTPSVDTRILVRTSNLADWQVNGTHVSTGFVSPVVRRDNLTILSADYTLAETDNCNFPATSAIGGNTDVCINDTGEIYTVSGTAGSTFTWSVTGGVIQGASSGIDQTAVSVNWDATGQVGEVQVIENNSAVGGCGEGVPVTLAVNVNPVPTSVISGSSSVVAGQSGSQYSVTSNDGYTYDWSISPVSDHLLTEDGSAVASIDWGDTEETVTISVTATNTACGLSTDPETFEVIVGGVVESAQTGAWNTGATWVGGVIPTETDNVRINANHTVNLPGSDVTINNLTIESSGRLQTVNSRELIINGNLTVDGVLESLESNTPEPNIRMIGNNAVLDGTGVIEFTANLNNNDNRIFFFENNVTIAASADLTFDHQDADNPDFIEISDNVIVTNNGSVTINRNIFGTNANATWINGAGASLSIGGTLLSTGILNAAATRNTVTYSGADNQNIKDPVDSEYYNLSLAGSNVKSLQANTVLLNNLVISSIFDVNGFDLTIAGNWTNTGTFEEGSQTVTFNGAQEQTISSLVTEEFTNLIITKSGTNLLLSADVQANSLLRLDNVLINTGTNKLILGNSTAQLGTLSRIAPATIVGEFERWVNTGNQNDLLFPVGTSDNYRGLEISFLNLTPGTLSASFIAENPGALASTPLNDNGFDLNNLHINGYWSLNSGNSLASNNYDLSLTAEGFSTFTISNDSRILARANSSSDWLVNGTHVSSSFTSPVVQRNGLSLLSAEFAIAENDDCTLPATSAISGVTDNCTGDVGVVYSVTNTTGSTYTWEVTAGTIASGQGTNSITVDWDNTGQIGQVSVTEDNSGAGGCGVGTAQTLEVNINPIAASNLTGSLTVSTGQTGVTYTVDNQAGYTYTWSVDPALGTFNPASPTGNSASIDWGSTAGTATISVVANNTVCGLSAPATTIEVTVRDVIESAQTGDWNTTTTWVGGVVPGASDNVRINSDHTVTLPGANVTVSSLEIELNGRLITVNSRQLILTSDLIVNGVLESGESNTPEPNIRLTGSGATLDGTGLIEFTGALNNNDNRIFFFEANTTIAATANLTFDHQDPSNPDFIEISDNVIVTNNGSVSINRNIFGTNSAATWINASGASLTVGGTLLSTGILDASASNNTITYNGSAAQTIKDPVASEYYNLGIAGSDVKSLGATTTVTNDVSISSTLDVSGNDLSVGGHWTNNGFFDQEMQTVTFNGSADQTISGLTSQTFYNLTVNKGGGSLILSQGITASNQLSLQAGTLDASASQVTLGADVSNIGTLLHSSPANIIGNFRRFINATGSYLFPLGDASNEQPVTLTFNNITSGTLTAAFVASDPGNNGFDLSDDGNTIRNQFTQGYWQLTSADGLTTTDYDVSLTANGFDGSPFAISTGRLIVRASASDDWSVEGTHVAPVDNTLQRTGLSTLSAEIGIGTTTNCVSANTNSISGDASVCLDETGVIYSAVGGLSGSTYSWEVAGGAIVSGQGTQSITVDWGSTGGGGSVAVRENNNFDPFFGCGEGSLIELAVVINPVATSEIAGSTILGVGNDGIAYSVDDNGYDYTWALPEGGSIISGQGTAAISIDWGSNPGTFTISVEAVDNTNCSPSQSASLVSLDVTLLEVIESAQTGDWNTTTTWIDGVIPGSADNVRINNGHTVSLPAANTTVASMDIREGGRLQTVNSRQFILTGNLTVDGVLESLESNTPEPNIILSGDGAVLDGTGTIEFTANLNNNNNRMFFFNANTTIAATANLTFDQQDDSNPDFLEVGANIIVTNQGSVTINNARNIFGNNANATWINDDNATVVIGGSILSTGILDASSTGNTIEYNGGDDQSIKTPLSSYANLTLSGSGNKQLAANMEVTENITISSNFLLNGFDLTLQGNWTNTGNFVPGTNQVNFNASADQTITNVLGETFYDLQIAKPDGELVMAGNVTVSNQLTMTEGDVNTSSNRLTLGTSTSNEGTLSHTSGAIIGEFERYVASLSSFTFPVGTSSNLRSFEIDYSSESSVTQAGSVVVEFVEDGPGTAGLPVDDSGYTVENTFSEGYWRIAFPNTVQIGNPEIRATADGFSSFTIDADTRLVSRLNSSTDWILVGSHESAVGNVVGRNDIDQAVTEFALGDDTACTPPSTSAISRSVVGVNCINDTGVQYEVSNTPGSTYTWTVDGGTVTSGQGTNQISITWGATGGNFNIRVVEDNSAVSGGCGLGTPVDLEVAVNPLPTSVITGSDEAAEGSTGVSYSVESNADYTYTWSVSNGSITSGQGTSNITVEWPTVGSGSVSVVATSDDCGVAASEVALDITIFEVIETVASGDWNAGATWEGGVVPQDGNSVRILNTHNVTLSSQQAINNIIIESGGTLTIDNSRRLDVNGNFTLDGTVNNLESNSTEINLVLNGPGATLDGTGTYQMTGNRSNNNNGAFQIAANLTIAATADLTLTNDDAQNPDILEILSDVTVTNNGSVTVTGSVDNNIGGNTGALWINAANSILNVPGTIMATGDLNASQSGNTVNYSGAGQSIKNTVGSQYQHLILSGSGTKTLAAETEILGNLSIDGVTLASNNLNLTLGGNWTNTGTFTEGSATVTANGTADQTVTNTSGETFNNLTINKSSGSFTLANDINITNTLTMTLGNINTGANVLTLGDNSIATGTLSRAGGHIVGNFSRWIRDDSDGTEFLFPLGDGTTYYPLEFAAPAIDPASGGTLTASFSATDPGSTGLPTGDDGSGNAVENAFSEGFWTMTAANGLVAATYDLDVTATGFDDFVIDTDTRLITRLIGDDWPSAPATPSGTHVAASGEELMRDGVSLDLTTGVEIAAGDVSGCSVINTSTISGATEACINTSNAYTVTGNAGNTFTWVVTGGTFNENGSTTYAAVDDTDVTVDWDATTGGERTITVTESSVCASGVTQELAVNVNPVVAAGTVSGNTTVQTGSIGQVYSVPNRTDYSYQWSTADGDIVGSSTENTVTINWTGTGTGQLDLDITFADPSDVCPNPNPTLPTVTTDITFFTDFVTIANGDFDDPSIWNCNCVPDLNADIEVTGTVTLTDNDVSVADLVIDGTLDNNGFEITVNRNYELNGTHSGTGNTLLRGNSSTVGGSGSKDDGVLNFLDNDKSILSDANLTLGGTVSIGSNVSVTNNGTVTFPGTVTGDNDTDATLINAANANLNISSADFLSTGRFVANSTGNTVTYSGTNQTIKSPAGAPAGYFNLVINGSGTKTINSDLIVSGDFTLSGSDFQPTTFTVQIGEDWINSGGTFTPGTSTVEFNGTAAQQISTTSGTETFYNLEIDNTSSGLSFDSNDDVVVINELILTDGLITTTTSEQLILEAATVSGSFLSNNPISYINGPLVHRVTGTNPGDLIFPVGKGAFQQIRYENVMQAGASADYSAEFFDVDVNTLTVSGNTTFGMTDADLAMDGLSLVGYWDIGRSGTDAFTSADLRVFYTETDAISDFENLTIAHANDINDAAGWTNLLPTGFGGSQNIEGDISVQITSFSVVTLANNGIGGNTLPVDLVSFTGEAIDGEIELNWTTASELNNDRFEVQHSLDGRVFETIGEVQGNGTTSEVNNYQFIDNNPASGANFYRLRQVDFDGSFAFSNVVFVVNTDELQPLEAIVFPNPTVASNLNLLMLTSDLDRPVGVTMIDLTGKVVYQNKFTLNSTRETVPLEVDELPAGIYMVTIQQGIGSVVTRRVSLR